MTDNELETAIVSAMSTHLDAAYWGTIAAESKTAAINMAKFDVLSRIPGETIDAISATGATGNPVVLAILEQAVYLLRNYGEQTSGKVITSESVEGLSVGYTLIGDSSKIGFSERAAQYVALAKHQARAKGIRFSRG